MLPILAATAILAVFTVSGCDINTGGGKPASVDCHCAVPVAAAPAAAPIATASAPPVEYHHRYHYRHRGYGARYAGVHGYYWRREYSEISVATYDYHSDSHSYYVGGHEGGGASAYAYAYAGGGASAGAHADGEYHVAEGGWIDGFGRGHGGRATTGTPVHYEEPSNEHDRMRPWHGYDADCPDKH